MNHEFADGTFIATTIIACIFAQFFRGVLRQVMRQMMPRPRESREPRRAPRVQLCLALEQGEDALLSHLVRSLRGRPNVLDVEVEHDRFRRQHLIEVTYRGEMDISAVLALTTTRNLHEEVRREYEMRRLTETPDRQEYAMSGLPEPPDRPATKITLGPIPTKTVVKTLDPLPKNRFELMEEEP